MGEGFAQVFFPARDVVRPSDDPSQHGRFFPANLRDRGTAPVEGRVRLQWSGNLTFPTLNTLPINATSSSLDGINVAISNYDAATETIVITVPAAKAADGKLFGRLQAAAP